MGMTITEKILARAAGKTYVTPGEFLDCKVDQVATMDLQGKLVFDTLETLGATKLFNKDRVAVCLDHQSPAQTVGLAEVHAAIRKKASAFSVSQFMDVGSGIMHVVMPERGLVLPGELVIMNESHTPTGGAVGACVVGVGRTDAAVAAATGEIWLVVPETIRINLVNQLHDYVAAKDIALYLMKILGYEKRAIYRALEIGGPGATTLQMDERFTITNYCSDMGAKSAIFEPDQIALDYASSRAVRDYTPLYSDADCTYADIIEIDLSMLEPQLACPHELDNIHALREVAGKPVHQAHIGTCTNGRLSDIKAAAQIVAGNRVAEGVRFIVVPASAEIYRTAMREGYLQVLAEAGAIIMSPGCGPCMGEHSGVLASGEVCISSGNRNMRGRMGSKESEVFLASAQTVAASAIAGVITNPFIAAS